MLDDIKIDPRGHCRRKVHLQDLPLDTIHDRDIVAKAGYLTDIKAPDLKSELADLAQRNRCKIKLRHLESLTIKDTTHGSYRAPCPESVPVEGTCSVWVEGTRSTAEVIEGIPFTANFIPSRSCIAAYDGLDEE
jgi:hypothetical protein